MKSEVPRIYETVPELLKSKKVTKSNGFNSKTKQSFISMLDGFKEVLNEAHSSTIDKILGEQKRQSLLEQETSQTNEFKNEILGDFKKLEKQMVDLTKEIEAKGAQIENMKTELIDKKDQLKRKDNIILDIKQDNNRFVWDIMYLLNSIKSKFENYQVVAENVTGLDSSMMMSLQKEINDPEHVKGLTYEDKKEAIKKLIHIISDITTTLHFENKNLLNSDIKVKELTKQMEAQYFELTSKLDQVTLEKEKELQNLQKQTEEKYVSFMNESRREYDQYETKTKEE